MKIHRFIDNFDLSKNEIKITGEIAHQIIKVLKLKTGEKIELCDGKGIYAIAEIVEIGKNIVLVKIGAPLRQGFAGQNRTKVNLFCSILKKENFELVVQKTTECGVSKIIPIITSRTIKTGLNMERLRKIAKEASEQCGRINIPEILEPIEFIKALKIAEGTPPHGNILFDVSGEPLGGLTAKSLDNLQLFTFNLFVGPEGGWTPKEIEVAKSLNFKIASLGPLTLRGETAAIIATYLISN